MGKVTHLSMGIGLVGAWFGSVEGERGLPRRVKVRDRGKVQRSSMVVMELDQREQEAVTKQEGGRRGSPPAHSNSDWLVSCMVCEVRELEVDVI